MKKQYGIPIYAGYNIAIPAIFPGCQDVIPIPDKRGTYLKNPQQREQSRQKESSMLKKL